MSKPLHRRLLATTTLKIMARLEVLKRRQRCAHGRHGAIDPLILRHVTWSKSHVTNPGDSLP
jgi:hypothetical protein